MKSAQVVYVILKELNTKNIWFWVWILIFSATGPLIATYIFSRGIAALETGADIYFALFVFFVYFSVLSIETFLRIGAKTRIYMHLEEVIVSIEKTFVNHFPVRDKHRSKIIQAARNLADSLSIFSSHLIESGIAGLVSFISVPILLFFIDIRIFVLELVLMFTYIAGTYLFGKKYEKQYEGFDAAKESYFTKMNKTNNYNEEGKERIKEMHFLQNIRFKEWVTLQNLIIVFKFLVIILLVTDILNGLKSISDLVLIIGYTNQSQSFLNSVTGVIERFMEVFAGVDRMVIVTHKAPKGSITRIA